MKSLARETKIGKSKDANISSNLRPVLNLKALPETPGIFNAPGRMGLVTKCSALAFDRKNGEITNFVDRKSGQEFISRKIRHPLFEIVLSKPQEGKRGKISSRDFRKFTITKNSADKLILTFDSHPVYPLSARVTASLRDDQTVALNIHLDNPTSWCVAGVRFPETPAPPTLGASDQDDFFIAPWCDGALFQSPAREAAPPIIDYPRHAFAQFYAYYDGKAGEYVAMDDPDGHCKRFNPSFIRDKSVSVTIEHQLPEIPGRTVDLPYSVLLRTFQGDWHDAADIYKAWATRQTWCARRLSERPEVPQFLKEGSGIIISGIGDLKIRKNLLGEKLEKLPDLLDAYRERTGLKHMIFIPYGWENRGTWAGINYFPAIPSNDLWIKMNATLKSRGHRTAFLTSGWWWVIKRDNFISTFDDSADFKQRNEMCVRNADGSIFFDDKYNEKKSWKGLTAALCHGSPAAQKTMEDIFHNAAQLDVPLISFDQEMGGGQEVPCYSPTHGHPPGYGNWMWTGFRDTCAKILKENKTAHPELGLFLELESELAIPYMSTFWSRQFGVVDIGDVQGGRCVGLYSYLYHEYVTAIGAAIVQGQGLQKGRNDPRMRCQAMANILVRGLIPGPFITDVPFAPETEWEKQVSQAYFSYCQPYSRFPEYLILGKTLHPLPIECAQTKATYQLRNAKHGRPDKNGEYPLVDLAIVIPSVTTGSFQAEDGSVASFIVNTTPISQKALLFLPNGGPFTLYRSNRTVEAKLNPAQPGEQTSIALEPFGVRVLMQERSTQH